MSEEHRKFLRLEGNLPIMYWMMTDDAKRSVTKDIGPGGICLFIDEALSPGMQLQMQVLLPGRSSTFEFIGEVVWTKRASQTRPATLAGVRFVSIGTKEREAILEYCMRRVPSELGGRIVQDRRKFPRLSVRLPISYRALSVELLSCPTKDVGGGGVRLLVAEPLPITAPLVIEVTLPDRPSPVSFVGEVVWCETPSESTGRIETGIKFLKIDPVDRLDIMRYVERGRESEK